MIVTPSAELPGHRVVRDLGLVKGNTIRARHVGSDITAQFKRVVGGEIREYTKMMAEAREQAMDRMIQEAEDLGAQAVLNVRYSTSYVLGGAAEILVYGAAVQVEAV
jgi:uncharacterized protein YbjQ (UPF0145 family)